ncbi:MAG: alkaline phosphatase D family protein [Verrucomicrobia bacterium]|nr:alkaline phosphatase D family protein [Verrucomicrobiota bacterium]
MSKSASKLTRRRFLSRSAALAAGSTVAAEFFSATRTLSAAEVANEFRSAWDQCPDRVWAGPEFWTNPMQDWRIAGGRLECINAAADRNVHVLTRQLADRKGTLQMSVRVGRVGGGRLAGKGSFGFRLGILGTLKDYPEHHDYRNNLWPAPGAGFNAGVTADGGLFVDRLASASNAKLDLNIESVELRLNAEPKGDAYEVTLTAFDAASGKQLGQSSMGSVSGTRLVGNVALVSNFPAGSEVNAKGKGKAKAKAKNADSGPNPGLGQFWFSDWRISGTKFTANDAQAFGPILWSQYTVSGGVLKMSAQMPPLGAEDSDSVRLQTQQGGAWKTIGEEKIHPQARTATFRIAKWDDTKDAPYRLAYTLKSKSGSTEHFWNGTVRRDPVDRPVLTVGDVSCNIHSVFPNVPLVRNMAKLNPDLLAFTGDQFYESTGGYNVQRAPLEPAIIDYLRKWYFHGWTWRELMRDRPSVSIPDDHDVYQGNLWGEAGDGKKTTQEAGGYDLPAEWVNVVHRTQTSHHPDAYDARPCKRGTTNYYGPLTWGRVSFAILADRQYKSGPEGKVPPTGSPRGDHVMNPDFDPKTADLPGLQLLGETQMKFLREWAADWRGAEMKAVISQTIFTAMATTHGGAAGVLQADYDANGWPQSPRHAALRELRRAFAFHLAGDQHLPAVVHYGIDGHRDAGAAFAGPAVNVGYRRWWEPARTQRNKKSGNAKLTGDFLDHFGNPVTVLAVKNGPAQLRPAVLDNVTDKTSGLGVVRFDKRRRVVTVECWPYDADPTKGGTQFEGWPVTVSQLDNYARKAAAHLPTLNISGVKNPVVQVFEEKSGELLYALRVEGNKFRPHVFAPGKYTVKVGEPETGKLKELTGLEAGADNKTSLEVKV